MTRAEITKSIRAAWTKALMDTNDLSDDIADSYSAWVRGVVQSAAADLQGQPAAAGGQQQQQGGQPMPEGGQAPAGGQM